MKITDELTWYDILTTSWSGARHTAEKIEEHDKGEEFCSLIEEVYPEGIDRTHLNDIMWFDDEWIFEALGIKEEQDEENEEEAEAGEDD